MWPTIHRARRRLSGMAAAPWDSPPAPPSPRSPDPTSPAALAPEDVVIVLRGAEVDHLRGALQRRLGSSIEWPDTPDRLERALAQVFERDGAPGRARVLRRPAGVSTPESWEIHLDGVDHPTATAVRAAGRTSTFEP